MGQVFKGVDSKFHRDRRSVAPVLYTRGRSAAVKRCSVCGKRKLCSVIDGNRCRGCREGT